MRRIAIAGLLLIVPGLAALVIRAMGAEPSASPAGGVFVRSTNGFEDRPLRFRRGGSVDR